MYVEVYSYQSSLEALRIAILSQWGKPPNIIIGSPASSLVLTGCSALMELALSEKGSTLHRHYMCTIRAEGIFDNSACDGCFSLKLVPLYSEHT